MHQQEWQTEKKKGEDVESDEEITGYYEKGRVQVIEHRRKEEKRDRKCY